MNDAHVDRSAQRTRHATGEISRGNKLFSFGHHRPGRTQAPSALSLYNAEGVYRKKRKELRKRGPETGRTPTRAKKRKETPRRATTLKRGLIKDSDPGLNWRWAANKSRRRNPPPVACVYFSRPAAFAADETGQQVVIAGETLREGAEMKDEAHEARESLFTTSNSPARVRASRKAGSRSRLITTFTRNRVTRLYRRSWRLPRRYDELQLSPVFFFH